MGVENKCKWDLPTQDAVLLMLSCHVSSPYYFLYISCNVSYENLILHQDHIPSWWLPLFSSLEWWTMDWQCKEKPVVDHLIFSVTSASRDRNLSWTACDTTNSTNCMHVPCCMVFVAFSAGEFRNKRLGLLLSTVLDWAPAKNEEKNNWRFASMRSSNEL